MTNLRLLLVAATVALANTAHASPAPITDNPFYAVSPLPFQAPQFDKIKDADYQPAIEEGMRLHQAEILAIANNKAAPTFDNTIVAMEKSGALLGRVMQVFGAISGANSDPVLQQLQEDEAPKLAAHQDAIYLNSKLFQRVDAIYKQRNALKLDAESVRLIEVTHHNFILAGAKLSNADKTKLKKLNEEESTLSSQFNNKLRDATKKAALVVDSKDKLAGLSEAEINAAARAAKERGLPEGKYVLALQNTTQQPALQYLTDRATRQALFEASWNRTEMGDANDTRKLIVRIAEIRAKQAKILGFSSFAAWKLDDQMAKTPEAAIGFMQKLVPAATARAKREAQDIQSQIDQDQAALKQPTFKLQPWDWNLYAEEIKKARYDVDENQIRPYFELDNVLQNGVFYAANQLYGLTFKERHDIPVYQEDVRVFEVFDKDGTSMALFYCDYFQRDNKNGGAWMDNFVGQSKLLGTKPVIYNVTNFTKPAPGQTAQLSFDDVITMFHEFGHGLHGIFANGQYPSLSGTATARDFVEFPSQFNEHWATDPKIFAHYAVNLKTGEAMPQALVDKIKKAGNFNKGYAMTELSAAALLDLDWHSLSASAPLQDANQFETAALNKEKISLPEVPSRYRSSYFLHIWANGYAAGYYAYPWTQMLADDAFDWFQNHGGLTRDNGDRFRAMILSQGNSKELAGLYQDWRGSAPRIEPMLENRGLKE